MLATNTTTPYPKRNLNKFSNFNYNPLKENIHPAIPVSSSKLNEKKLDFSLYSNYLRPNTTSKKKRVLEEPIQETPLASIVNIASLGIGPEV